MLWVALDVRSMESMPVCSDETSPTTPTAPTRAESPQISIARKVENMRGCE